MSSFLFSIRYVGCLFSQENVSYICSRYYRAPELVFEAVHYTTMIDIWSLGCVLAELLLGHPLFPGEAGEGQRFEIMNTMGTPTREELAAMNSQCPHSRLPNLPNQPWSKVFRAHSFPEEAIDLVTCLLRYDPTKRLTAFDALAHPFFDALRDPETSIVTGSHKPPPNIHNWTADELTMMAQRRLANRLIPPYVAMQMSESALRRAGYDFTAPGAIPVSAAGSVAAQPVCDSSSGVAAGAGAAGGEKESVVAAAN